MSAQEDRTSEETGLRCPDPTCDTRFHNSHDEHRIASLVYHLHREHPVILSNLKMKLGADE